jgi:H+/Cl- antiporter ClcA
MMILSVIIASIVNYITALYLLNHVPNICTAKNPTWKCLNVESSYSASIIWGVVGKEKRLFLLNFTYNMFCQVP